MYKMLFFVTVFQFCVLCGTTAQPVMYNDLSKKYFFEVSISKPVNDSVGSYRHPEMTLSVLDRNKKIVQKITYSGSLLFDSAFRNRTNSRSYTTGARENAEVVDYDYGDIVVADLNFDGREDIAVKTDSGGDAGPWYTFFVQGSDGHFHKDRYLTDSVSSFPASISTSHRTLTLDYISSNGTSFEYIFSYNQQKGIWHKKFIKTRLKKS
jgi:hypothetical protein